MLDQVALPLVCIVATSGYERHLTLLQVCDHLLMICKNLNRVWQDLGKFKVADIAATRALVSARGLLRLLLEFTEGLE